MGDAVSPPPPLIHRRNSISVMVAPPQNPSSSGSDDLEFMSIKPVSQSYTSLRDILPSVVVNSPKPDHQSQPGSNICIRNRLVKQAAWAYLQPMSTSPGSSGNGFFHRIYPRVSALLDFIRSQIVQSFNWMLRLIRIRGPEE